MDWIEAEEYLKTCESAYAEIGTAGLLTIVLSIAPLRNRFNEGERTQELYNDIFAIEL